MPLRILPYLPSEEPEAALARANAPIASAAAQAGTSSATAADPMIQVEAVNFDADTTLRGGGDQYPNLNHAGIMDYLNRIVNIVTQIFPPKAEVQTDTAYVCSGKSHLEYLKSGKGYLCFLVDDDSKIPISVKSQREVMWLLLENLSSYICSYCYTVVASTGGPYRLLDSYNAGSPHALSNLKRLPLYEIERRFRNQKPGDDNNMPLRLYFWPTDIDQDGNKEGKMLKLFNPPSGRNLAEFPEGHFSVVELSKGWSITLKAKNDRPSPFLTNMTGGILAPYNQGDNTLWSVSRAAYALWIPGQMQDYFIDSDSNAGFIGEKGGNFFNIPFQRTKRKAAAAAASAAALATIKPEPMDAESTDAKASTGPARKLSPAVAAAPGGAASTTLPSGNGEANETQGKDIEAVRKIIPFTGKGAVNNCFYRVAPDGRLVSVAFFAPMSGEGGNGAMRSDRISDARYFWSLPKNSNNDKNPTLTSMIASVIELDSKYQVGDADRFKSNQELFLEYLLSMEELAAPNHDFRVMKKKIDPSISLSASVPIYYQKEFGIFRSKTKKNEPKITKPIKRRFFNKENLKDTIFFKKNKGDDKLGVPLIPNKDPRLQTGRVMSKYFGELGVKSDVADLSSASGFARHVVKKDPKIGRIWAAMGRRALLWPESIDEATLIAANQIVLARSISKAASDFASKNPVNFKSFPLNRIELHETKMNKYFDDAKDGSISLEERGRRLTRCLLHSFALEENAELMGVDTATIVDANQAAAAPRLRVRTAQEWCHLHGHGDGGDEVPENMVAGSRHCNTEQLAIELGLRAERSIYASASDSKEVTINLYGKFTAYLIPGGSMKEIQNENDSKTKINIPWPLADFIRYKIFVEKYWTNETTQLKEYSFSKVFDYVIDAQSEHFDYNEFKILEQRVRRAIAAAAGQEKRYELGIRIKYEKVKPASAAAPPAAAKNAPNEAKAAPTVAPPALPPGATTLNTNTEGAKR